MLIFLLQKNPTDDPRIDVASITLPRSENMMHVPNRHWLDYDSVFLAVLMIAISILELLVLGI